MRYILLLVILIQVVAYQAQQFDLQCKLQDDGNVEVTVSRPSDLSASEVTIYRSIGQVRNEIKYSQSYPLAKWVLHGDTLIDSLTPDGYTVQYIAVVPFNDKYMISPVRSVSIPLGQKVSHITNPNIYIDKLHYILELRDGNKLIRRYPVALGRNPVNRKIRFDNASTPEGVYQIEYRSPNATFYKALGVSYPNSADHVRYNLARELNPSIRNVRIGGSIQIHGCGNTQNWTFGCIAMANGDIDDLFRHREVRAGVPVIIVGDQVTPEMIPILQGKPSEVVRFAQQEMGLTCDGVLGPETLRALGREQHEAGLPLSCLPDEATISHLQNSQ